MKKFDYIRLSQAEANRRIWKGICIRHEVIRQGNVLLSWLWMPLACFMFGCIAVLGWLSSLSLLFRDIRYSPHYLKTGIVHSGMDNPQALVFLDAQFSDYQNRLSYGHVPVKKQKSIEATFELLYQEYRLPESDKGRMILTGLSELKCCVSGNFSALSQLVSDGNREVKYVSSYTRQRQAEEEKELSRKQRLAEEQVQRQQAARKREKGRMLSSFESAMSNEQIDLLAECCNSVSIFTRNIEAYELQDILFCTHAEALPVGINKHIAVLFDKLREHKLICRTWMKVAEKHRCFVSKKGKPLVSKDLSAALSSSATISPQVEDEIEEWVNRIVQFK